MFGSDVESTLPSNKSYLGNIIIYYKNVLRSVRISVVIGGVLVEHNVSFVCFNV